MQITDKITLDFRHNLEEKITSCIITKKQRLFIKDREYVGIATCGKEDSFNRKIGRKLSLIRAIEKVTLTKEERSTIWNTLKEKGVKLAF